jgi:hypothetical protein
MRRSIAYLAALAVAGCSADSAIVRVPDAGQDSSGHSTRYLPVGTVVPAGEAVSRPIEPYDPAKHGPALRIAPEGIRAPEVQRAAQRLTGQQGGATAARAIHFGSATWGESGAGVVYAPPALIPDAGDAKLYGIYGVIDAQLNVSLPAAPVGSDGIFLFSPTTSLPERMCLEMGVLHWRPPGQGNRHEAFIRDWCDPDTFGGDVRLWGLFGDIVDDYVRTYQGESTISFTLVTPNIPNPTFGTCSYAHFYNYTVGGWVEFLQSCKRPDTYRSLSFSGWTMWLALDFATTYPDCPTTPSIRALDLQVAFTTDNTYHPLFQVPHSAGALQGTCFQGTGGNWVVEWPYNIPGPGTSWRALTPSP